MKTKQLSLIASLLLLLFLSGCAPSTCLDCGRLVSNHQVDYQFQSLQILSDHRYYYSGEILEPDAIVAIHQDYVLEQGFWTEIQLTKKQLKEWMWMFATVEDTWDEDDRMTINYEGRVIVAPDGNRVGVYFSKYHHATVMFPGNNTIKIYKPAPPLTSQMLKIREL